MPLGVVAKETEAFACLTEGGAHPVAALMVLDSPKVRIAARPTHVGQEHPKIETLLITCVRVGRGGVCDWDTAPSRQVRAD
jgi:hypothetical protein